MTDARLGVYVHIPFCARRCGYCAFATWTDREHLVDAYVDACVRDLERQHDVGVLMSADTVFFGGGTPSLLTAEQLQRVLDAVPRALDAEVTVECNPDSVDADKLGAYRAAGVTRVSFGVQSMRPHVLAYLDRTHEPANVRRAVAWARDAGFTTFNLDLIYGAPVESLDDWRATLDEALALDPPHLSAYALGIEPATPLAEAIDRGARRGPEDDDQAAKYEIADAVLGRAGLDWYEISNWCRPGHECRHNRAYWDQGVCVAIGCAAHGHRDGRRWWNVRTPERYLERVTAGDSPVVGEEELSAAAIADEALSLALRTRDGADVDAGSPVVDDLVDAGLLVRHDGRVVLTLRGRLLGSEVTARLLAHQATAAAGTR